MRRSTRNVPLDEVVARLSAAQGVAFLAAAPAYFPDGLLARREAFEIVDWRRYLDERAPETVDRAILAAAKWYGREAAWVCGRPDRTGIPRACGSAWCEPCDESRRGLWRGWIQRQWAYDEALNRHWWFLTSTVDPARQPGPAAVQIAIRSAMTRYLRWLRGRGGKEHLSFIERSAPGHWHNHALLRAPWLDTAACSESGMSWHELAAALDPHAIGDRPSLIPRLVAELRQRAVGFGLASHGFDLAPVRFPLATADYLTEPMVDDREQLLSTVIGVKRITFSPGFFDRHERYNHYDDALPRVRHHATECNPQGDSDVDNG